MNRAGYKKHLQPALYGVLLGSVIGAYRILPTLVTMGYLKHHLYYTSLRTLMMEVNGFVLLSCLALYALHAGRLLKNTLRIPCFILSGIAFIRILAISIDWGAWAFANFRGLKAGNFARVFLSDGAPQIVISILCLAAGIFILRRLRRGRAADAETAPSVDVDAARVTASPFGWMLDRATPIVAIFSVPFLLANAACGVLAAKNKYDNRSRPNVIYIMVDTLRADHLGCYGYARNTSPNIDKLAGESTRFSRAISQAPWTTASVSSFMTGRYLHISMDSSLGVMPPPANVMFMPELLKDRGYSTAAVISNTLAGKSLHLNRGYERYYETDVKVENTLEGKQQIPGTVLSKSLEMIKQMKGKRFFLYSHFMGPHSPYAAHPEYNFYPDYKGKLSRDGVFANCGKYAGDDLKYATALYDEEIAYTDHYIGLLLDELKKQGLYDNTLIVLFADHGEGLNEHGEMQHGDHLYDDTLSVPLIIKLPKQNSGSVVGGVFSLVDLLPSVAEFIGCNSPALEFDGRAIRLDGLRRIRQSNIYSSTDTGVVKLESLRSETTKLILDRDSKKTEMFDLVKDPAEKRNIAKEYPSVRSSLQSVLNDIDVQIDAKLSSTISSKMSASDQQSNQKALRALGYLQ